MVRGQDAPPGGRGRGLGDTQRDVAARRLSKQTEGREIRRGDLPLVARDPVGIDNGQARISSRAPILAPCHPVQPSRFAFPCELGNQDQR